MPGVANNASGNQDAIIWRLLKELVSIEIIAMHRPAGAVAICNEVVLGSTVSTLSAKHESHQATFQACKWSRRAKMAGQQLDVAPDVLDFIPVAL